MKKVKKPEGKKIQDSQEGENVDIKQNVWQHPKQNFPDPSGSDITSFCGDESCLWKRRYLNKQKILALSFLRILRMLFRTLRQRVPIRQLQTTNDMGTSKWDLQWANSPQSPERTLANCVNKRHHVTKKVWWFHVRWSWARTWKMTGNEPFLMCTNFSISSSSLWYPSGLAPSTYLHKESLQSLESAWNGRELA